MIFKDNILLFNYAIGGVERKKLLGQWEKILKFKNTITMSLWLSLKINTSKTSYSPMSTNNLLFSSVDVVHFPICNMNTLFISVL